MTDAFWDAVCRFRCPQTFADYDPQSRGADGTHDGEAEISAGAWLDGFTAALAARPRKERDEFAQICKAQEAEMRMCLDPPSIILAWSGPDGSLKETRFRWQHTPMNDILHPERIAAPRRRITSFPMTILVVAAELVADTWRRRATAQPIPPSGSNPESGSAPDRPGSEAPTRTNQPRNRATGQCNNPKVRRVCVGQQAHGGSRGPIQLMKEPRKHEARP